MKVVLRQDVESLGQKGEVVQVKAGYGRNFLIPRGLATVATRGNIKALQEEVKQAAHKLAQARNDAEALAEHLNKVEVTISVKVGEEDRIFGTVTTTQVAEALAQQGVEVDRRKVELSEDIKHTGIYHAHVRLHADVAGKVKVIVVAENMEDA